MKPPLPAPDLWGLCAPTTSVLPSLHLQNLYPPPWNLTLERFFTEIDFYAIVVSPEDFEGIYVYVFPLAILPDIVIIQ